MQRQLLVTWESILDNIAQRIDKSRFQTWFSNTKLMEISDETLVIGVPSISIKDWLINKYEDLILEEAHKALDTNNMSLKFKISPDLFKEAKEKQLDESVEAEKILTTTKRPYGDRPRPDFSLEKFVVGTCNRIAHSACMDIITNMTPHYNPLFIYGGSGLGKTHLLHSIWSELIKKQPNARVLYMPWYDFRNRYLSAVSHQRLDEFRHSFKKIDILLIDDIHFLSAKEKVQNELINTFDELYNRNKQIIISSDAHPRDIVELAYKLKSRFLSGLVAKLDYPDFETRCKILATKAKERKFHMNDEIVNYISKKVTGNVRELEGALTWIAAYAGITKEKASLELAKKALQKLDPETFKDEVPSDRILKLVSQEFSVKEKQLTSMSRARNILEARQLAIWLFREYTELSLNEIGNVFGGRNHSTIVHSLKVASRKLSKNRQFSAKCEHISQLLDS